MSFHLLYVLLFLIRSGAPPSHDSADCWSAHIASCPRQFQTCARLMPGWLASVGCPPPPQQKSGLLRWLSKPIIKLELSESCCSMYTKCIQCQYRIYNLLNIYLIQWTDFVYFLKTVKYSPFEHIWVVILHIVWSVCDVIGVTWWHLIGDILSEICTKFHPPGCIFWSWTSSLQTLPPIFWKHVVYVIY